VVKMSEQDNKGDSFHEFASQALRLSRRGSFENLLCQHLIMSVAADPLTKVRLVCEAGWMVDADKIGLDLNRMETVYTVALSFLNTNPKTDFLSVAWGFSLTPENYKRFIALWRRKTSLFFCTSCQAETKEKSERLEKAKCKAEWFYLMTHDLNLSSASFNVLKSEYLRWAIPLVMEIFEKLSRLVQPDLYREMLRIMKGEITQK
jgi:hypothetical protein